MSKLTVQYFNRMIKYFTVVTQESTINNNNFYVLIVLFACVHTEAV